MHSPVGQLVSNTLQSSENKVRMQFLKAKLIYKMCIRTQFFSVRSVLVDFSEVTEIGGVDTAFSDRFFGSK